MNNLQIIINFSIWLSNFKCGNLERLLANELQIEIQNLSFIKKKQSNIMWDENIVILTKINPEKYKTFEK